MGKRRTRCGRKHRCTKHLGGFPVLHQTRRISSESTRQTFPAAHRGPVPAELYESGRAVSTYIMIHLVQLVLRCFNAVLQVDLEQLEHPCLVHLLHLGRRRVVDLMYSQSAAELAARFHEIAELRERERGGRHLGSRELRQEREMNERRDVHYRRARHFWNESTLRRTSRSNALRAEICSLSEHCSACP